MLLFCFRYFKIKKLPHKLVRLKSSVLFPLKKTNEELSKNRIRTLSENLDCNILTAQEITVKNKSIFLLDPEEFDRNINFCKKVFKLSDLVEFPLVFTLNSSLLQHRYYSLKDLGFSKVTASNILKFSHILKKTPKELKREGLNLNDLKFESLTNYINDADKEEIISKLVCMYNDGSNLWKIKEALNAEFLIAKLGCSITRAHHLFHSYPPLRLQSIVNTDKLLNVLLEKFGLPYSKIYQSLNLLSLHPETVEKFLLEIPEILGINLVHIVNKQPLTLRRQIKSILKVESVLKEFNITTAQLMSCPKVVVFSPNTLKDRLTVLCNSKDFSPLKTYKKFLWLVYYYNNLNARLEALKTLEIPCSISMFTVSKNNFTKYYFRNNICINECRTHINDICFYLSQIFNVEEKEILQRLKEYPSYQNPTLVNSKEVVEYLLQVGVTKKQIFNGIGIIFYDANVVRLYFENLKHYSECKPFEDWNEHYNLIQLLIYTIEVDTGFQGSRAYKINSRIDEKDELLASFS